MTKKEVAKITVEELVAHVDAGLRERTYSPKYQAELSRTLAKFSVYEREHGEEFYAPEHGRAFMKQTYLDVNHKNHTAQARAINALYDYWNYGEVFRRTRAPETVWNGHCGAEFELYYEHYKTIGYRRSSNIQAERSLRYFMQYLEKAGISKIEEIDTNHLYAFIEDQLPNCGKKHKNRTLRDIRYFLEYLHSEGISAKVFDHVFPSVRTFANSEGLPNVFTKDEVSRLLAAVDRGSPLGKRDYAILLLATRYGLRASDIKGLEFTDIDWKEKKISISQSKTGNPLVLPLLEDIGWSIIDYIDHGRPVTDCPCIFVIHNAPYDRFVGSMNHLITKYMNAAKIPVRSNRKPGLHALRHSLACELLREGTPISTIKEVLGHASISTTFRYQRMDMNQLAMCALEVPCVQK
jgi:site-specific recombinase XerD